ncbi:MAG: methyltransferase [Deltaproteobacteria bacterium]|nr:methyltransferase [Deltaproteobacteria bacterium]
MRRTFAVRRNDEPRSNEGMQSYDAPYMSRGDDRPSPLRGRVNDPHSPPVAPVEKIGRYSLIQSGSGQKLTEDTLLLADFILPLKKDDIVADLGAGPGALALILASRSPVKRIVCVEVQRPLCGLALENVAINGLTDRVEVIEKDFRELPAIYPEGSFSLIVSNPPYMKAGEGRVSPVKERAISRTGIFGGLEELIDASKYLCGPYGRICYVFPARRLDEMCAEIERAGLRKRRLRLIYTRMDREAKLFLIEAGKKGELKVEEPVYLRGY